MDCQLDCRFFRMMLEHVHDEIFITDHTGRTLYCNAAIERFYNVRRSDVIGADCEYLVRNKILKVSPVAETIKTREGMTCTLHTADGSKMIVTSTQPILDADGNVQFVVGNTRDITEIERLKIDLTLSQQQLNQYKRELENLKKGNHIIAVSPQSHAVKNMIEHIAPLDASVLLTGESGTGKSMYARYLHDCSNRCSGPFVSINCAAIPDALAESELFGYVGGAFTGARAKGKKGLIEQADGGTLFLDEIGDLSPLLQSKLLNVLQEHHLTPVGSVAQRHVDVRLISATNHDLEACIERKEFRSDLYYRIKVVNIDIPPLRCRAEDISVMIRYL